MGLNEYHKKRDFSATPEPKGAADTSAQHRFVVQEHHASHLHFDFRLEMGGVLKSWAVPKGPSMHPADKRLAVMTEDHPVEYLHFQGRIAAGNYGAGEMVIWDSGDYVVVDSDDPEPQVERGRLSFTLHGAKLRGEFSLVRMHRDPKQWLLIKAADEFADRAWKLQTILPAPDNAPAKRSRRVQRPKEVQVRPAKASADAVSVAKAFRARRLEGDGVVESDGYAVSLTHLDKVYWPEAGYTKGDLLRYYFNIAPVLLPYLKDRPLILKRYPDGFAGKSFYQHDVEQVPEFLTTVEASMDGAVVRYAVCNNLASLLYLVNLGTIAQNPWHSTTDNLAQPTWIVFDLDPEEGGFDTACEVSLCIRDTLRSIAMESYAKTSGASGMHVYVPLKAGADYANAARFAQLVAELVRHERPDLVTLERSVRKRESGRVYLDHMQNARGKTVVSPYSVRAVAGATVSAPLTWAEVKKGPKLADYTLATMSARVKKKGDLFGAVLTVPQEQPSLAEALSGVEKLHR